MKKVLNVGGNNKGIALTPHYASFEHLLLDIDPRGEPDLVCDARQLDSLEPGQFEAVYCSHNLEHYYRHEVRQVLAGFLHVLKDGGFAHIRVPDIHAVMRAMLEQGLDVDNVLYQSDAGPIMVADVLWGHHVEIERSGKDYYAHKIGFTEQSLAQALRQAGFGEIYAERKNFEVEAVAFKGTPNPEALSLFGISED